MKNLLIIVSCFASCFCHAAEKVVWSGEVNANGTPTEAIDLLLHKNYKLKVQGTVNLGKWWQAGKPLEEDACYEFNTPKGPEKNETFANSMNISVCDGKYHDNHIYTSETFAAKQNKIHFWIQDHDYSDNSGSLHVELIQQNE